MARVGKTGRPSKLTPEVVAALEAAVRIGASPEHAADAAGISRATLATWLKDTRPKYRQLAAQLDQARGERVKGWLQQVTDKAASKDPNAWRAADALLRREDRLNERRGAGLPEHQPPVPLDIAELQRASTKDPSVGDGSVLVARQMQVLEAAYMAGRIDDMMYLEKMDRLTQRVSKLAELAQKQTVVPGQSSVSLVLRLESSAVRPSPQLPDGVLVPGQAAAGGDLIEAR